MEPTRSSTPESGLGEQLRRELEDAVARRGFVCAHPSEGGRLVATLEPLVLEPVGLSPAVDGGVRAGAWRVHAVVRAEVLAEGRVVWESGPIRRQDELLVEATGAGGIGLERQGAIRRSWARLSREAAEQVIQQLTDGF